jgi:hypothetical protein
MSLSTRRPRQQDHAGKHKVYSVSTTAFEILPVEVLNPNFCNDSNFHMLISYYRSDNLSLATSTINLSHHTDSSTHSQNIPLTKMRDLSGVRDFSILSTRLRTFLLVTVLSSTTGSRSNTSAASASNVKDSASKLETVRERWNASH